MNKYLQDKIVAFLVIFFIMMPSLSLAQGLSNSFNKEDYKIIKTIIYDKVIFGEKLDTSNFGPGIVEHMSDCIKISFR